MMRASFKDLSRYLGIPQYQFLEPKSDSRYLVYIPHKFLSKSSLNPKEKLAIKYIRASYLRYGKVPLLDKFDAKSEIIIIKSIHPCHCGIAKNHTLSNYFSIRFIPGKGVPKGVDDFLICKTSHGSVGSKLHRLSKTKGDIVNTVVSLTRICITESVCSISGKNVKRITNTKPQFWLANFVLFNIQKTNALELISALFRPELLKLYTSGLSKVFNPAFKVLGFKAKKDVSVVRYPIAYMYPGYYFNKKQLTKLIYELKSKRLISKEIFNHILRDEFKNAGPIFMSDKLLTKSKLTGGELRDMLDKYVDDGPVLQIATVAKMKNVSKQIIVKLGLVQHYELTK